MRILRNQTAHITHTGHTFLFQNSAVTRLSDVTIVHQLLLQNFKLVEALVSNHYYWFAFEQKKSRFNKGTFLNSIFMFDKEQGYQLSSSVIFFTVNIYISHS